MTDRTCPNGCDLATFGTHAGPPDCDLQPADPGARIVTAIVRVDGREQRAEVALPSSREASSFPTPPVLLERLRFVRLDRGEPVEFATVEAGPAVLVRLPDTATIPPAVLAAIEALSTACREAYGYGVEVIADDRDEVREALDLIRRHVDR